MQELLHLRKILREAKTGRVDNLSVGSAKDYAAYQRIVGEVSGLSLAINEIETLLDNIQKVNDDF